MPCESQIKGLLAIVVYVTCMVWFDKSCSPSMLFILSKVSPLYLEVKVSRFWFLFVMTTTLLVWNLQTHRAKVMAFLWPWLYNLSVTIEYHVPLSSFITVLQPGQQTMHLPQDMAFMITPLTFLFLKTAWSLINVQNIINVYAEQI